MGKEIIKEFGINDYVNLIENVIHYMKRYDKNIRDWKIQIKLEDKSIYTYSNINNLEATITIPKEIKVLNDLIDNMQNDVKGFYDFIYNLFPNNNIRIEIFTLIILHEIGHISFNNKYNINERRNQKFHASINIFDDFLWYKLQFKGYRLSSTESYSDVYAMNNFIKVYNHIKKKGLINSQLIIPEVKFNIEDLQNNIHKISYNNFNFKYSRDIKRNELYDIFIKEDTCIFSDINGLSYSKNMINKFPSNYKITKKLFRYILDIIFASKYLEEINNNDFKDLLELSDIAIKTNRLTKDVSLNNYLLYKSLPELPKFIEYLNNLFKKDDLNEIK